MRSTMGGNKNGRITRPPAIWIRPTTTTQNVGNDDDNDNDNDDERQ